MDELINWILKEIRGGADMAELAIKLDLLAKVFDIVPSYEQSRIVTALIGGDDAE